MDWHKGVAYMNGLFVVLYVNNRICQHKIDELIQNSTNGFVNEGLVFGCKNIYLPISIQEDRYFIQNKSSNFKIVCDNEIINGIYALSHGDYFFVQNEKTTFSFLVLDSDKLSISASAYSIGTGNVFIGRSNEMNIVVDINGSVSRKCAAIRYEDGNHFIEDLSGKTGIYVNGKREISKQLNNGDNIHIMGTNIIYYPEFIIVPSNNECNLKKNTSHECLLPIELKDDEDYVRTPRIVKSKEEGKIVIDAPPAPQRAKDMPFILTVGPSLTMSLAMLASLGVTVSNALNGGGTGSLVTSGVMALSMLAGALLWPSLLRRYNKKQEAKNELYRKKRYTAYLSEKESEIKNKYERNIRVLNENLMPSPETLASFICEKNRRLWERTPKDDDFLKIRLGRGISEFSVDIQAPHKGFTLDDDPMLDNAIALREKYRVMKNVPIALSLSEKKVTGVVGATIDILKVIVTNIVSLHSSDEVKLVLIYNSADAEMLKWANDLPHTWSNDKRQRYVATNREETKALLSNLDEMISERELTLSQSDIRTPHFVILVLDEYLIEDMPFKRVLLDSENAFGISTVFFGKRFSGIPKECIAIIQKDQDVCGMYVKNENDNRFITFAADEISDSLIESVSNGINKIPVKVEKGKASVPERVSFLDMYRVGNVEALEIMNHWKTNISEKSLAAPIGIKAGGEVFALDIHEKYHGCHGLVAGTTGSGKSEFLQAYILSMMINYSPNEVAFVLVDFKGGDMARPFLKSPHLAATISNLSGNTLHRALISLEAEVKSRQNIFNKSAEKLGVDKIDINSYQKYFKEKKLIQPLPHLIIVIDEFAQLKSQHPEFMAKLVDVAQVGRSLGIHLILATQRPSGVIDPQIWSNSKFKVCLKVLDKQDSMDMINHPEAALIKQPGRAYVQVGYDEIFEQIQSGYSGADYIEQEQYIDEESVSVHLVNWTAEKIRSVKKAQRERKSNKTQLEKVVSLIASIGENQSLQAKQLWLPPLPLALLLKNCTSVESSFDQQQWDKGGFEKIVCGIADLPEKQEQIPFGFDFVKDGHLAIYGSSGTGKSTLIQTILFSLALKYSPELYNVFVMDFDGNSLASVASMPHCAKYASESDERAIDEVIGMIQNIIAERHEKFAQNHCANFESYISSTNEKMPMIMLVIDNYAAFREKMYRSEDALVQIISAARSCGIYLIVTGNSKGAIYYKITEQIPNKVVLNMNDTGAYRDILNVPVPILPEQTRGRGLTAINKKAVEVQFAVPFDTANETARTTKIHEIYAEMQKVSTAVEYHFDPAQFEDLASYVESTYVPASEIKMEVLPSLDDESEPFAIGSDITTKESKGFVLSDGVKVFIGTRDSSEIVSTIANNYVANTDKRVCLVTSKKANAFDYAVEIIDDVDEFVSEFVNMETEERQNTVLLIDEFCDFYDRISDEALLILERALKSDIEMNIVTFDAMKRLQEYRDTGLYVHLVRAERGVIVGGYVDDDVASAITTDIYEVPKKFREKALGNSQAIIYRGKEIAYINIERG